MPHFPVQTKADKISSLAEGVEIAGSLLVLPWIFFFVAPWIAKLLDSLLYLAGMCPDLEGIFNNLYAVYVAWPPSQWMPLAGVICWAACFLIGFLAAKIR